MEQWLYCNQCGGEFQDKDHRLRKEAVLDTERVTYEFYCPCGNQKPLDDMAEINMANPEMRQEAEFWVMKKHETERLLAEINQKLEDLWYNE